MLKRLKTLMEVEIGKKGLIIEGDKKGWYVRVDEDSDNTGGFLILTNPEPDMSSTIGHDNWVENEESLRSFFLESSWTVEWIID
jgi:hypothetical protein